MLVPLVFALWPVLTLLYFFLKGEWRLWNFGFHRFHAGYARIYTEAIRHVPSCCRFLYATWAWSGETDGHSAVSRTVVIVWSETGPHLRSTSDGSHGWAASGAYGSAVMRPRRNTKKALGW